MQYIFLIVVFLLIDADGISQPITFEFEKTPVHSGFRMMFMMEMSHDASQLNLKIQ